MGALAKALMRPDETIALGRMYLAAQRAKRLPKNPTWAFCYDMLNRVSRSFAVVIQQLPRDLRDAVCVFYLVLRGLDTVEDDMALEIGKKLAMLESFCDDIYDRDFVVEDCGEGHYKTLMLNFNLVCDAFLGLDKVYQEVIYDITRRMAAGMAEFIPIEVERTEQYDRYCHYVAGLVGIGLSNLFAACGLESTDFYENDFLSNEMGLFLQKTNIIRDFLEDINEEPAPRMFWPKEIWGDYAPTGALEDFTLTKNRAAAVHCLNHMITDALAHAPHCLEYMSRVRNPWVFRFCAIPQAMAIGTLALCYGNGGVFEGVVKIRRGQTAKIVVGLTSFEELIRIFHSYAGDIRAAVKPTPETEGVAKATLEAAEALQEACRRHAKRQGGVLQTAPAPGAAAMPKLVLWLLSVGYASYAFGVAGIRESLGVNPNAGDPAVDLIQKILAVLCLIGLTFILLVD